MLPAAFQLAADALDGVDALVEFYFHLRKRPLAFYGKVTLLKFLLTPCYEAHRAQCRLVPCKTNTLSQTPVVGCVTY